MFKRQHKVYVIQPYYSKGLDFNPYNIEKIFSTFKKAQDYVYSQFGYQVKPTLVTDNITVYQNDQKLKGYAINEIDVE